MLLDRDETQIVKWFLVQFLPKQLIMVKNVIYIYIYIYTHTYLFMNNKDSK